MAKFLLWSILIFTFAWSALGQDPCAKPPKDIDDLDCCDDKWEDDATFIQCDKSWPNKEYCAAECVANASNIISNGQYKAENLKALLEKTLKNNPSFIPIATKAFEECYPMAKEKLGGKSLNAGGCNALLGIAMECAYVKMFLNCPADKVKNSKDCPEMKAYFTKCPLHIPPPS